MKQTDAFVLAQQYANDTSSIDNVKCPAGVVNPGLFFGYLAGWDQAILEYYMGMKSDYEHIKEQYDTLRIENEINKVAAETGHRMLQLAWQDNASPKEAIARERDELKAYQLKKLNEKDLEIKRLQEYEFMYKELCE